MVQAINTQPTTISGEQSRREGGDVDPLADGVGARLL